MYRDYGDSVASSQVLLDEHLKFEETAKVCHIPAGLFSILQTGNC